MKHVLLAFMLIVAGALAYPVEEEVSPAVGNVLAQAYQYIDQGETGTAIALLDDTLSRYPDKSFDRYALLNCKFNLLSKSAYPFNDFRPYRQKKQVKKLQQPARLGRSVMAIISPPGVA